jgi:hypothetical protein
LSWSSCRVPSWTVIASFLLVSLAACSKPGTCLDEKNANMCTEYSAERSKTGKTVCLDNQTRGAVWTDGAGTCRAGYIGSCNKMKTSGETEYFYAGTPMNWPAQSVPKLRSDCESAGGTWQ